MAISHRLRALLDHHDMTATHLARLVNCTPATIRNYLRGDSSGVRRGGKTIRDIAAAFGAPVTPEWLATGDGPNPIPLRPGVSRVAEDFASKRERELISQRQEVSLTWYETDLLELACKYYAAACRTARFPNPKTADDLDLLSERLVGAWGDGDVAAGEEQMRQCRAALIHAQGVAAARGAAEQDPRWSLADDGKPGSVGRWRHLPVNAQRITRIRSSGTSKGSR
jgi:transcriptional regulator with XRE-family HTH domain